MAVPTFPDMGGIMLRVKSKQRIGDLLISYFVAIKKNSILTRKGDKVVKRKSKPLNKGDDVQRIQYDLIEFKALGPEGL